MPRLPDLTPRGWDEDPPPPEPPVLEVFDSDNPVVAELLDADGTVIRQWRERPPFGFQVP
jgi:hypothetical protein